MTATAGLRKTFSLGSRISWPLYRRRYSLKNKHDPTSQPPRLPIWTFHRLTIPQRSTTESRTPHYCRSPLRIDRVCTIYSLLLLPTPGCSIQQRVARVYTSNWYLTNYRGSNIRLGTIWPSGHPLPTQLRFRATFSVTWSSFLPVRQLRSVYPHWRMTEPASNPRFSTKSLHSPGF